MNTIKLKENSSERVQQILTEAQNYSDHISDTVLEGTGFTAVTEAYSRFEDIPLLKIQKRILLPYDKKNPFKGEVILLNTTSLADSINLVKKFYPMTAAKYKKYFIDYKYRIKIMQKIFVSNNPKLRIPMYADVESQLGINCVNKFPANHDNCYFDMSKYNQMYLEREQLSKNIGVKISAIFTIMKNIINDSRFDGYHKTMVIDAESWISKKGIDKSLVKKEFDNLLFIFYYTMLKDPDAFKSLGDIDMLIVGQSKCFKINPSKYNEKEPLIFKRVLNKVTNQPIITVDDKSIDTLELKTALKQDVANFQDRFAFTGDKDANTEDENKKEEIDVDEEKNNTDESEKDEIEKVLDDAEKNDENEDKTYREIVAIREKKATGRSTASIKRDKVLRERQAKLKVDGIAFEKVDKIPREDIKIPINDVSKTVHTTNQNITKIGFPNIEKTYIKKMYRNDILRVIKSLNDKKIKMYVTDIQVEDSSTELDLKETWTIKLEDENRVRHTIKVDMPKFYEDRYVYLGGNKKVIIHQQMMKPIVKTNPDTVQLVSSEYNRKIFISRYQTKSSSDVEMFKKTIDSLKGNQVSIKRGNSAKVNTEYVTFFEYDELSKVYKELKNKKTGLTIMLNQAEVHDMLKSLNVDPKPHTDKLEMCIGFSIDQKGKKVPIWFNTTTQLIDGLSFCHYVASAMGSEAAEIYDSKRPPKRAVYSQAIIMKKKVPLILLLSYLEGMTTILRRAKVQYTFTDTRPKAGMYPNQGIVRFADGYLVYSKTPFANELLMNGLSEMHCDLYEFAQFDEKDVYYDIIETLYGKKILASAFEQFYEFFIGPITKEALDDFNYPTDFAGLMLYANELLADNKYITEMNYNNVRIRSSEIAVTFLYEAIATAYLKYKNSQYNNNPVKMSVPQDYVLKQMMTNQIVENYSKLNPMVEAEKLHACTPKGPAGMNLSDAFTLEKRSYDKSMIGVIGMSSSPDGNVGVVKSLSLEPTITNARGYLDLHEDDLEHLKDVNLFTPGELLSPLGASRDDTTRTSMAVKQSKHVIPVENSSPVLISNGSEQVIQYHLSNDFVVTAEEDGVVKEINEKSKLIVVEYTPKNEPHYFRAINIGKTIDKNGAGGFFLSNQLKYDLKQGQKFKKNDILAYDSKFFSNTLMGNKLNMGSLEKIACMQECSLFEDSTYTTEKAARDMATEVVMEVPVTIGKNATVDKMVKVGDNVLVGDELIVFENSFEEESLNKLLGNIGDELKEEVKSFGKTPIKAKYSGVIEDIQIYSGSELSELSPTLQKVVGDYWKGIRAKKAVLNKYDKESDVFKCGMILNQPDHPVETKNGKFKGNPLDDGVLIIFFIKYKDIVTIGDKVTFFTALKGTVGDVIPEGYEPYTVNEPNEHIELSVAPLAVNARMTPSILITMFGYKVLIKLKDRLREIYEE